MEARAAKVRIYPLLPLTISFSVSCKEKCNHQYQNSQSNQAALTAYRAADEKQNSLTDSQIKPVSDSVLRKWRDAGTNLRSLWSDARLSNSQKKRIIRALVDKVVLKQSEIGKLQICIVWKSGRLTSKTIDVKVGSLSSLPKGDELAAKIVELARQDLPDEWIAFALSCEGYRGCDRPYVGLRLVERLRSEASIKKSAGRFRSAYREHGLTISQLSKRLKVKTGWIFEQIVLGRVKLAPHQKYKRFLIAADSETVGELEKLSKAGVPLWTERRAS